MKRKLLYLLALSTAAFAAPITGLFIGGQPRTLNVGKEPYCLRFDHPVAGATIESPAFAVELAGPAVCFRALAPGTAKAQVTLEGGERLEYTLLADPTMPAVEIRVILPEPTPRAPSAQAPEPRRPTESKTPPAPGSERPKHSVAPVDAGAPPTRPTTPKPVPPGEEDARLADLLKALEDVLVEISTEPKPSPAKSEAPAPAIEPPAQAEPPTVEPGEGKAPPTRPGNPKTRPESGYAPAKPRAEEDPTVIFKASLFPGKETYRISYTLLNKGKYPLITDPKRFELRFNGERVNFEISQRASSGFVGWVPPGFEEAGTLAFPPLTGEGLLELRVELLKLNPTRDSVTLRQAWRLASLPVVVPGKEEGER